MHLYCLTEVNSNVKILRHFEVSHKIANNRVHDDC